VDVHEAEGKVTKFHSCQESALIASHSMEAGLHPVAVDLSQVWVQVPPKVDHQREPHQTKAANPEEVLGSALLHEGLLQSRLQGSLSLLVTSAAHDHGLRSEVYELLHAYDIHASAAALWRGQPLTGIVSRVDARPLQVPRADPDLEWRDRTLDWVCH